jgi:hypothetical protein
MCDAATSHDSLGEVITGDHGPKWPSTGEHIGECHGASELARDGEGV